jgi:hypothetical protein
LHIKIFVRFKRKNYEGFTVNFISKEFIFSITFSSSLIKSLILQD